MQNILERRSWKILQNSVDDLSEIEENLLQAILFMSWVIFLVRFMLINQIPEWNLCYYLFIIIIKEFLIFFNFFLNGCSCFNCLRIYFIILATKHLSSYYNLYLHLVSGNNYEPLINRSCIKYVLGNSISLCFYR